MKMSFRWYGVEDTISLKFIRQIPDTNQVVWALHNKVAGEVWTEAEVAVEVAYMKANQMGYDVVESVNIHEDIKLGLPTRDQYIKAYRETIRSLGKAGVKVICYNFMPVFDWTRTNMHKEMEDGATALFYEQAIVENIDPQKLVEATLASSSGYVMPGWERERLKDIRVLFERYGQMTEEQLWENLAYFLNEILPVCEENGITMAIHPDDPSWTIFGLPRIIKNAASYRKLRAINQSWANGITFCSGSLATSADNDLAAILRENLAYIPFIHLRNIKRYPNKDFIETAHKKSYGDVDIPTLMAILKKAKYDGYVRPDHGRHIWDEVCRPGYGLYDRALGITYLWGLWDACD
ncbi:MAG: mannonate dehydratase [Culicoidibacterales bacterium]